MTKTKTFMDRHRGPCNTSHDGACSACYLFRHRPAVRRAMGGDPSLCVPEPGRVTVPALVADTGPCRFQGRELTGPERQLAGLDHVRKWRYCLNPTHPLGERVCECRGCGPTCPGYARPYPDGAIVIEQGAGGIGDAALLLPCVHALRLANPGRPIVLRVGATPLPFVREFHGYDSLEVNHRSHSEQPAPDAIQANCGYTDENRTRYPIPRWERYQRNIGSPGFQTPDLRDPDRIRAAGADVSGCVALCVGSTDAARRLSLHHWLTIERLIIGAGCRTVVFDTDAERVERFRGDKVIAQSPERVLGAILNAAVVVGTDSGLPHLAGLLRRPVVVLGGSTPVAKIFGAYPTAVCVQGDLDCSGCGGGTGVRVDPPYEERCRVSCSNLQSITPDRVFAEVMRVLRPGSAPVSLPVLKAGQGEGPSRLDRLPGTVRFRAYTDADDREQARHLEADQWLYGQGRPRFLCSILGAVEEQLRAKGDDELARQLREAVMIGRRLNDFGTPQQDLDWTSPPKFVGG